MISHQFRTVIDALESRGLVTVRIPRNNGLCLDCLVAEATGRRRDADVSDVPVLFWYRCSTPGCKCILGKVRGSVHGVALVLREHGLRVDVDKDDPQQIEIRGACR